MADNFTGTIGAIPTEYQARITDEQALAAYNRDLTSAEGDNERRHSHADKLVATVLYQAGYPQLASKYLLDCEGFWYA